MGPPGVVAELREDLVARAAASSSASSRGDSGVVIRLRGAARIALRPLAELHVHVLVLTVPNDLQRHRVARVVLGDQLRQVGFADDLWPSTATITSPPAVAFRPWNSISWSPP